MRSLFFFQISRSNWWLHECINWKTISDFKYIKLKWWQHLMNKLYQMLVNNDWIIERCNFKCIIHQSVSSEMKLSATFFLVWFRNLLHTQNVLGVYSFWELWGLYKFYIFQLNEYANKYIRTINLSAVFVALFNGSNKNKTSIAYLYITIAVIVSLNFAAFYFCFYS